MRLFTLARRRLNCRFTDLRELNPVSSGTHGSKVKPVPEYEHSSGVIDFHMSISSLVDVGSVRIQFFIYSNIRVPIGPGAQFK